MRGDGRMLSPIWVVTSQLVASSVSGYYHTNTEVERFLICYQLLFVILNRLSFIATEVEMSGTLLLGMYGGVLVTSWSLYQLITAILICR